MEPMLCKDVSSRSAWPPKITHSSQATMKAILTLAYLAVAGVEALPYQHAHVHQKWAVSNPMDAQTLNYALFLGEFQEAFYGEGLKRFDQNAFEKAGYPPFARNRYDQIYDHEQAYVRLLNQTLGSQAVQPCNYSFPLTDVKSFVSISQVLEGVATSAYVGAAKSISSDYQNISSSITAMKARHAGWIASALGKISPWSGPFETPLTPNQTFTLTAPFIKNCPSNNTNLHLTPFPALSVSRGNPGSNVTFTFKSPNNNTNQQLYAAFFSGLNQAFTPIQRAGQGGRGSNGTQGGNFMTGLAHIPDSLKGQAYAVVTNSNKTATDDTIVAGPAVLVWDYNSAGNITRQLAPAQ